jgi:hypothetical protein
MSDTTTTTVDVERVVEGYFAMWNETDPARRREVIAATWVPVGSYVDPMFAAYGYAELDALVAGVHQRFPGHRFRLVGGVDAHHDRALWGWELAGPDGAAPVAAGTDFAVLAADGRLGEVTGFFAAPGA